MRQYVKTFTKDYDSGYISVETQLDRYLNTTNDRLILAQYHPTNGSESFKLLAVFERSEGDEEEEGK